VARTSWFDDAENPLIEEQVQKLDSFVEAMSDGVVEKRELDKQQERLIAAMKAVEPGLNDQQHAVVTKLLIELSAYNVMRLLHELQSVRLQKSFKS
jgi:hypothetical protein